MISAFPTVLMGTERRSEAEHGDEMARTISGRLASIRFRGAGRAAGRGLGLFGRVRGALGLWRERHRRRRELAAISERDLADLGVPLGLAAYEAGRWPWQKASPEWQAFGAERHAAPPVERLPPPLPQPDRERDAPLLRFPSPRRRA